MKVKILKKNENIKTDENGNVTMCIKSLFCSVDNSNDANALVSRALEDGSTKDQAMASIKPNTYDGEVTYTFGLNCSSFTFDRVDKFGILDISPENIKFKPNGKYTNARIAVINKREQINGYEEPVDTVEGWITDAPAVNAEYDETKQSSQAAQSENSLAPQVDDLPF